MTAILASDELYQKYKVHSEIFGSGVMVQNGIETLVIYVRDHVNEFKTILPKNYYGYPVEIMDFSNDVFIHWFMNLITALEIYNNYPDQIKIDVGGCYDGKYAAYMYRLKGDNIHKLMLSTNPVFFSKSEAKEFMESIAKSAVKYIKELNKSR